MPGNRLTSTSKAKEVHKINAWKRCEDCYSCRSPKRMLCYICNKKWRLKAVYKSNVSGENKARVKLVSKKQEQVGSVITCLTEICNTASSSGTLGAHKRVGK